MGWDMRHVHILRCTDSPRIQVDSWHQYGVDWDGPLRDDDGAVIVPTMTTPLSSEDMEELISQINPLAASDD